MFWSDKHSNSTVITNGAQLPLGTSLSTPLLPLASHESLAVIRIMPCDATARRGQTLGLSDCGTALDELEPVKLPHMPDKKSLAGPPSSRFQARRGPIRRCDRPSLEERQDGSGRGDGPMRTGEPNLERAGCRRRGEVPLYLLYANIRRYEPCPTSMATSATAQLIQVASTSTNASTSPYLPSRPHSLGHRLTLLPPAQPALPVLFQTVRIWDRGFQVQQQQQQQQQRHKRCHHHDFSSSITLEPDTTCRHGGALSQSSLVSSDACFSFLDLEILHIPDRYK